MRRIVETAGLLTQMRKGALQYCVLALLRDTERYAFELVQEISGIEALAVSEGTLYPLLSRLRRDGLVAWRWTESGTGPPRRYYQLTEDGRRALTDFAREWRRFSTGVERVLAREDEV